MTLIVNLSSIFKLKPIIPDMLRPFVALCNQYSTQSLWCCGKTLFGMTNHAWVAMQYYRHKKTFDDYKLGKMTTDQFLDALLNVFSFLKNNKKVEVKDPRQLLADAWNEIIVWDKESTTHLKQLVERANKGEPLYLVSNTNPLNIEKVLTLFKDHCPEEKWDINSLSTASVRTPIKIAHNVHLCLSYNYGLYKEGTPGLIETIVKDLNLKNVTVVSQFPGDLKTAERLHLTARHAHDFYENEAKAELAPALH